MKVIRIVALALVLLTTCSSQLSVVVTDRWWQWERVVQTTVTTYIPMRIGQTTTLMPSTRTVTVCQDKATGYRLPPEPPSGCAGGSDNIRYFATVKPDGEKERRVEFKADMWDGMTTGRKVCLEGSFGFVKWCD